MRSEIRFKIPASAKRAARRGLRSDAGLTVAEASKLRINSGRARARQLIANKTIGMRDLFRVAAFYSRFRRCNTRRCNDAIDLWGGRAFGLFAMRIRKVYKSTN